MKKNLFIGVCIVIVAITSLAIISSFKREKPMKEAVAFTLEESLREDSVFKLIHTMSFDPTYINIGTQVAETSKEWYTFIAHEVLVEDETWLRVTTSDFYPATITYISLHHTAIVDQMDHLDQLGIGYYLETPKSEDGNYELTVYGVPDSWYVND